MGRAVRFAGCVLASALAFAGAPRANAPHIYAIQGARLVTAAGAPIDQRDDRAQQRAHRVGRSERHRAGRRAVIDGSGHDGVSRADRHGERRRARRACARAAWLFRTTEEAERWKRSTILHPELQAADIVRPDAPELSRLAGSGVTSVLATPATGLLKGQSALVNVSAPVDEPQIGAVADPRKGLQIVRTPVALHVALGLPGGRGGPGYPVSLLGTIAFVRQSFLDAQYQQLVEQRYERAKAAVDRPVYDASLDAMQPALGRKLPVAFDADLSREILRALNMAKEFNLDPVITGAREADQVIPDLKARNARVIFSLNFPTRSRALPPDADEPIRDLRARAAVSKAPAALEQGGVLFAFSSGGLPQPRDFVRNAARAVKDGLPPRPPSAPSRSTPHASQAFPPTSARSRKARSPTSS